MKISLFASSVRPQLYESFFKSLENEPLRDEIEVVFAGNVETYFVAKNFRRIITANIKPAQCYEIARRNCKGEVVVWVADDCIFNGNIISNAYEYWKSKNNNKLVLSLQVSEYNNFCNMADHCLAKHRGRNELMAPIGMMSRDYLNELGGLDQRFICGQYENSIVMRVFKEGGACEVFGDKESYVFIDHHKAWELSGESKNYGRRPFALGFPNDRQVLEGIWVDKRLTEFEPFVDDNLLTESQGNNIAERWI